MNAVRLPREDREYLARERADENVRRDTLRMTELILEPCGLEGRNWLSDAVVHYLQTGDVRFLAKQIDTHVDVPVIQQAVEKDYAKQWSPD